ncbi:PulJ/GspJ family protein [Litchfieldia alkalitelluris]|uniref:PulJ/GspJ family protein n=1 Tax=Litchfieldia alkalitelluris TaxID=304268 RepID=UPI000997E91F|nr:prepilin-type N-terminal cleavage/methylation domain-containing protein [Litchfieldia alkalitelluris]
MKKYILNNRGLTLIELLASLVIFSLIMGLISGLIINSANHFEVTKKKVSLSQEANLILAQLTRIHQTKSTYIIDYNYSTNEIKIDGNKVENSNIVVKLSRLGQSDYKEVANNVNLKVSSRKPLYIEFSLSNYEHSEPYKVKTVINRY